jgi:hypothetical protein
MDLYSKCTEFKTYVISIIIEVLRDVSQFLQTNSGVVL